MTWATRAAMPAPRELLAAAADSSGRIYAIGGNNGSSFTAATNYRYDPATNAWTTRAAMPTARNRLAAAVDSSGRIYAIGGFNGTTTLATVERYDPATNAWTSVAPMPTPRRGLAAAVDSSGRIYAIGGLAATGAVATVERYDPATNAWTSVAPMPAPRELPAAAVDSSGRIYAIGGFNDPFTAATNFRYDPATNAWTYVAAMPTARSTLAAAVDSSGRIYAIGGNNGTTTLATVERYDPATNAWTSVAPMPTPRSTHGSATDSTGRIYAIGGRTVNGNTSATVIQGTFNNPPTAPVLTAPADNKPINRSITQRFGWTFSDDNSGDSQSRYDLRYRLMGAGAWTDITGTTPNSFHDFAPATFAAGNYEWQARTWDAQGLVGPYSSSGFFTADDAPAGPTITAPTSGSTISNEATVTWSTPEQDAYQLRRVADNAGAADETVVYYDTGEVTSTGIRSRALTFETNNRSEHIQLRVKFGGLWSAWASIRVLVSYTPPERPSFTLTPDSASGSLLVGIVNPAPSGGQPAVSYNDVYIDDGGGEERRAAEVATNGAWRYWTPRSGRDYAYNIRVIAIGDNGAATTGTGYPDAFLDAFTDTY